MLEEYELSIAVPAYNEIKSLPLLIDAYREARGSVRFQLVIVDNGSSDGTAELLAKEIKKAGNGFIKVVSVKKNIGYGYGVYQGLNACDARVIGWSHADLQCEASDVFEAYSLYKKMYKKLTANNKMKNLMVKGHREGRNWKPLVLSYGLQAYSSILLLMWFDDINGQPKLFPKELLKSFKNPPNGFSFDLYAQLKARIGGYAIRCFKVDFKKRQFGVSKAGFNFLSKSVVIRQYLRDVIDIVLGRIR